MRIPGDKRDAAHPQNRSREARELRHHVRKTAVDLAVDEVDPLPSDVHLALYRIVEEALNKVEVFRLTIIDVQGFGRQKGHSEVYRGHELTVNLLRKVQLQIAVNEDFVEPTVNAIMEAGRTGPEGRIGDGKIFILPLEDCIRIRTGERGPEAI